MTGKCDNSPCVYFLPAIYNPLLSRFAHMRQLVGGEASLESKPVTCARYARMLVSDQRERTGHRAPEGSGSRAVSRFGLRAACIRTVDPVTSRTTRIQRRK
jgi:hypothetical protein